MKMRLFACVFAVLLLTGVCIWTGCNRESAPSAILPTQHPATSHTHPTLAPTQSTVTAPTRPERLELQITGGDVITLECGTSFREPGAEAFGYGPGLNQQEQVEVIIQGQVDTGKPGKYEITYTAAWRGQVVARKRTVHVVDTTPPEILLRSDPGSYTLPGQPYREEGFTAWDTCDGDLTDQVERTELEGRVLYTVRDTAGNEAQVERVIRYFDPVPPELELYGQRQIRLRAGEEYREPGYTARDNCDGDLTAQVRVAGHVDIYTAGTYVLTYVVQDSYGNMAVQERTVIVSPIPQPEQTKPKGKTIYLTFDDGPGPDTERLLEILDKYDVKATFFVMNTSYIHLLPKIAQAGHSIGVHTTTHRYDLIYTSQEAYFADLFKMQQKVQELTGIHTTLIRFPGGSSNKVSKEYCPGLMTRLVKSVTDMGLQYYDWNVTAKDAGGAKSAQEVYRNVIEGIGDKKIAVVLQHDCYGFSVDAVEQIILWGLENGYTFRALTPESPSCKHNFMNN